MVAVLFATVREILENTPQIVRSFALTTRVADYTGDSVIASIGDILAARQRRLFRFGARRFS
jgi:hypothetical protein